MADFPRRMDQAQWARNQAEQTRRIRTNRPKNWDDHTPTFIIPGPITVDLFVPPKLIIPGTPNHPCYKRILGFDGWLNSGGPVTINWNNNAGVLLAGHEISGGSNPVDLPTPFVINERQWIQIEITAAPGFNFHLGAAIILEVEFI